MGPGYQPVRRLPHGGENHHHVISSIVILYAAPCHIENPLRIGNGTAAEFLYD